MTDKPKCPDCNDTGLTPLYNPDGTPSGDVDTCDCGFGRDDDDADTDAPECVDHWHCDPKLAAHICDQGTSHRKQNVRVTVDRTKPCPTCHEAPRVETTVEEIHIVFDGPPGPESGRFVEVETPDGRGISVGEWKQRADGYWVLVLRAERSVR